MSTKSPNAKWTGPACHHLFSKWFVSYPSLAYRDYVLDPPFRSNYTEEQVINKLKNMKNLFVRIKGAGFEPNAEATSDLFEQFENDPKAANSTLSMIEKAISTSQQSLMKSARLANDKSALLAALASSKYNKSSKSNPMKRNRYDSDEEFEEPGDEVELKDGGGEPASTTSNSSSPPKAKQPASAAAVSAANNIDRVPVTFTATSNGNIPQVAGPPFGIINWSEHRLYYLCRVEEQTVMKIRVFADESYVELQFISPPPTKDELFEAGITPLEPTGGNFTYFVRAVVPDYAILDSSHTHRFESKSFKGVWFETKYQEPEPLGPKPVFEV